MTKNLELFKEMDEIEKSFEEYQDNSTTIEYSIEYSAITNILLFRLNKKIDLLIKILQKKK